MSRNITQNGGRNLSSPFGYLNNYLTNVSSVLNQKCDHIPLDYIKARVVGISFYTFMNNSNLEFIPVLGKQGVIHSYYCIIQNMKVVMFGDDKTIYFDGSLHKFFNNGLHNYNDFDFYALLSVLERIKLIFGISPCNLEIEQLEYGFNIVPPIKTNQILNSLLEHGKREFERNKNSKRGKYLQIERKEYFLKIYNKAIQYKQPSEILRFEIKNRFQNFVKRNYPVKTLQDFLDLDKRIFLNHILEYWNDITLFDPSINTNSINQYKIKYRDIENWRGWFRMSDTTLSKHRKLLKQLNDSSPLNVHKQIRELMIEKFIQLQGLSFSDFTQKKRSCLLTGIDISVQRFDSFLLSHKGLKHLKETDLETFERIKRKYLSCIWLDANESTQIKEIAHNIRTTYSNRQRTINPNQIQLSL